MHKLIRAIHEISPISKAVLGPGREYFEITLALGGPGGKEVLNKLEQKLGRYGHTFQPYAEFSVREIYRGSAAKPRFKITLQQNGKLKIEKGNKKKLGLIETMRVTRLCNRLLTH